MSREKEENIHSSDEAPKIVRFEDEEKQELDVTEGTSTPGKQIVEITEKSKESEKKQVSNSAQVPIESEKYMESNVVNVEELGGSLEKEDLEVPQEFEKIKENALQESIKEEPKPVLATEMEQKPTLVDPNQPKKPDDEETEQNPPPVDPIQSSKPNDNTNQESYEEGVTSLVSAVTDNNQSPSVPSGSSEPIKPTAPKTNCVRQKERKCVDGMKLRLANASGHSF
ncbi:hypothetical protein ACTXT7_003716 [Hymenolepis weldensis]